MNTLQVASESPWLVHAGAATILFLHIGGGSIAILAGGMALAFRKGSRAHVAAGNIFFVSMLVRRKWRLRRGDIAETPAPAAF